MMKAADGGLQTTPGKSTHQQLRLLDELVKQHPELDDRKFSVRHKDRSKAIWTELGEQLNAIGPPSKSAYEWKRVWITRKYKRKLKRTRASYFKRTSAWIKIKGPRSPPEAHYSETSRDPEYDSSEDHVQSTMSSTINEEPYFEVGDFQLNVAELTNGRRGSHGPRRGRTSVKKPTGDPKTLSQTDVVKQERDSSPEISFYISDSTSPTPTDNTQEVVADEQQLVARALDEAVSVVNGLPDSNELLQQTILVALNEQKEQLRDIGRELRELRALKAEEVRLKSQQISLLREEVDLVKKGKWR